MVLGLSLADALGREPLERAWLLACFQLAGSPGTWVGGAGRPLEWLEDNRSDHLLPSLVQPQPWAPVDANKNAVALSSLPHMEISLDNRRRGQGRERPRACGIWGICWGYKPWPLWEQAWFVLGILGTQDWV